MVQVNREGYDARETKDILATPVTELSRLIGEKYFLGMRKLASESGVPYGACIQAIKGKEIPERYEKRLRAFLEAL